MHVVTGASIWLRQLQESLSHILASPGYDTGTIAINFTWMERKFNACQTPRSMYPSIFNRFPVIEPENSKVRHFSTFLYILASPGYAPGTIAVNVTCIEREFNACQTHGSMYIVHIYFQPFTSYSEILVRNLQLFPTPPLHLTPLLGLPMEFRENV